MKICFIVEEIAIAVYVAAESMMASGCATGYAVSLRNEFSDEGKVHGVYFGEKEYPCIYPATKIAVRVEIPTWWWVSKTEIGRGYEVWLWPLGAPLSLADVALSVVTDTVMFPYDLSKVRSKRDTE